MAQRSTNSSLSGLKAVVGAGWDPATGGIDASGRNLHQRSMDAETAALHAYDDPAADPLGIGRMQASQNLMNAQPAGGWSDWLQALNERAPGGVQTPGKKGDPMPGLSGLAAAVTPYKSNPIDTLLNQQVEAQLAKEAAPGYWKTGTK